MTEGFQDLTGSTFERADMQGSTFEMVLLNGSTHPTTPTCTG